MEEAGLEEGASYQEASAVLEVESFQVEVPYMLAFLGGEEVASGVLGI